MLRRSLESPDYLLVGESMLALARLDDVSSIERIEDILEASNNPFVQIYAAAALEILNSTQSIPALFSALKQPDPPPYLRDEIILSIAGILEMGDWYYPLYSEFLDRAKQGVHALREAIRDCHLGAEVQDYLTGVIEIVLSDRISFGTTVSAVFDELGREGVEPAGVFADASRDVNLLKFDRIAFLLAAVSVHLSRDRDGGNG